MDEILIEDKKYVSSKRGAKLTGYAKDYVGQLCREGRVPARLVGRSWYVLESAIQDHRFGAEEEQGSVKETSKVASIAWEAPRYEASSQEILPSIERYREAPPLEDSSRDLQGSWREWFDHIAGSTNVSASAPQEQDTEALETEPEDHEAPEEETDESSINVPIRAIYDQLPPEDLLPDRSNGATRITQTDSAAPESKTPSYTSMSAVFLTILAILTLLLALIGSGYLDSLSLITSTFSIISGAISI